MLVPTREHGIGGLGKGRSEMNRVESAKRPSLRQFSSAMHNVLGNDQPVDRRPHLIEGGDSLARVRCFEPAGACCCRNRRPAFGVRND